MPWNTPITWVKALVTVDQMNQQVRDNLSHLFAPPFAATTIRAAAANYTTTSTAWVNIDSVNLSLSITPAGQRVEIYFLAPLYNTNSTSGHTFLDCAINGVRFGGNDGLVGLSQGTATVAPGVPVSYHIWKTDATPNTPITATPQWRVVGGGASTIPVASLTNGALAAHFWIRGH